MQRARILGPEFWGQNFGAGLLGKVSRGIRSSRYHQVSVRDRKSTRLNSSHSQISYAVFCLKKKTLPPPETIVAAWLLAGADLEVPTGPLPLAPAQRHDDVRPPPPTGGGGPSGPARAVPPGG